MTFASPRVLIPARLHADFASLTGELRNYSGNCMGTSWSVRVVGPDQDLLARLQCEIAAILENIEAQLSHFRASSALRRFGELAPGDAMALPTEFAHVMRAALMVAELSQGAFDPTVAAAVDAWGFGARRQFSDPDFVPPRQEAIPTQGHNWRSIAIDEGNRLRQPGGVSLNLAAIAKGFAVDAVSEHLSQLGLNNHLVEVGGELRGAGMKPDQQPWWVALEQPAPDSPLPATRIALHDLAVATSGNYRRHYQIGERHVQHTIDPRTCAPVAHALASVTVIHEQCMLADAWATALMVLGPEAGLALAEALDLSALLQWRDHAGRWREATSTSFQTRFR